MIRMSCTPELKKALAHHGLTEETYQPAYNGTSVALDLYNAGPSIEIPGVHLDTRHDKLSAHGFTTVIDPGRGFIPTGLHIELPHGYAGLILERGSIVKTNLMKQAGVIDPAFTAECLICCVNMSTTLETISKYAKTPFQLIVVPVVNNFSFIPLEVFRDVTKDAKRKSGSFGSSDRIQ